MSTSLSEIFSHTRTFMKLRGKWAAEHNDGWNLVKRCLFQSSDFILRAKWVSPLHSLPLASVDARPSYPRYFLTAHRLV